MSHMGLPASDHNRQTNGNKYTQLEICVFAQISFFLVPKMLFVQGKAAVDKMSADTAHDLKEHGVKVFSIYTGSVMLTGKIAEKYGFTDIGGMRPQTLEVV